MPVNEYPLLIYSPIYGPEINRGKNDTTNRNASVEMVVA